MRTAAAFVAAWRALTFAPANTLAVVMALVFAVGAWHAVGAVWDSTVGRRLPYRAPEELVALSGAESANPFGRFLSDREAAVLRERAGFLRLGWAPVGGFDDLGRLSCTFAVGGGAGAGVHRGSRGVPAIGKALSS